MSISQQTASILIDLIENKLAMLQIGDRDDLREVLTLQRCLSELRGVETKAIPSEIPHRGRHRKLTSLMDEMNLSPAFAERQSA